MFMIESGEDARNVASTSKALASFVQHSIENAGAGRQIYLSNDAASGLWEIMEMIKTGVQYMDETIVKHSRDAVEGDQAAGKVA